MSGDEKDNIELNNKEGRGIEMTVKVFRGGKFKNTHEREQMERILLPLLQELEKGDNNWNIYIDIEIKNVRPDALLLNEKDNAMIIIELKNITGKNVVANLDKEEEEWIDKETDKTIKYGDKKITPRKQCGWYQSRLVDIFKEINEIDDEEKWNKVIHKFLENIYAVIVVPENLKIQKKNYDIDLKQWLRVFDEKKLLEDVTKLVTESEIDFEKLSEYIKENATVPRSQKGIKELETKEQIRQFWRDLKEDTDESTLVPSGFEVKSKRLENDLSSDYPKDVEKALEVSNYLDYETDKIYELLDHENSEIRRTTLEHLENIDESFSRDDFKDRIGQLIHDVDYSVRKKIDELVIKYGLSYTRSNYLEIIESSGDHSRVMDAVNVMKRIGDKSAAKKLIDLYKDHQDRFGGLVEQKVTLRNGEDNDERELRYYNWLEEDRSKILESIKEIGCQNVIDSLIDLFENYEEKFSDLIEEKSKLEKEVRQIDWQSIDELKNDNLIFRKCYLFSVIGEIGGSDVIPFAKRYLDDPDFQEEAIEALGNSKDEKALSPLKELIENIEKKEGHSYRITGIQIIKALGKLGFEEGAEIIHEAIEKNQDLFKYGEVKDSLIKIGSQKTFDFLMNESKFDPFPDHLDKTNLDRVDRLSKIYYMLIKLNTDRFENEIFKILDSGNLKEKENLLRNLSDWIQKDNFKVSDDRLDRFVKILEEILDKRIKITYELLENVKSSIDSGGEKSNIDRMVKNANYRYVADDEQIETIEDLIRSSSIDYHNVASKAYLWKAERDEKLPWAKIRKHYIDSDKPMLRELGLRILNEILSNHPEMRDRIDVEEIIHLKDDNSKEIMIEASEKDPGRIGIYNYDPEKRFLRTLRHIGDNNSINLLIEYLKSDSGYNKEALTELHRIMRYDEVENNYWKMLDEPMPEWFFDKEKLDDLSREKFRTFLHVVGFYWGPKAIVVYRNLLEKNEEESLKQAILNAIPETGKDWVEPVSDFLKDLILDENWNISSKAIDVFNELNESHYSKDHVILKAAKDDLDDLWTDIDTS